MAGKSWGSFEEGAEDKKCFHLLQQALGPAALGSEASPKEIYPITSGCRILVFTFDSFGNPNVRGISCGGGGSRLRLSFCAGVVQAPPQEPCQAVLAPHCQALAGCAHQALTSVAPPALMASPSTSEPCHIKCWRAGKGGGCGRGSKACSSLGIL